jgi:hypothetical protein
MQTGTLTTMSTVITILVRKGEVTPQKGILFVGYFWTGVPGTFSLWRQTGNKEQGHPFF